VVAVKAHLIQVPLQLDQVLEIGLRNGEKWRFRCICAIEDGGANMDSTAKIGGYGLVTHETDLAIVPDKDFQVAPKPSIVGGDFTFLNAFGSEGAGYANLN
jgi:hypothetical protein